MLLGGAATGQTFSSAREAVVASKDDVDDLLPKVYQDLKRMAHRQLARLRPGDTLSTTALVHETYERLAPGAGKNLGIASREHLMALCARAMRQILIDHARERAAAKRGGGAGAITLSDHDLVDSDSPQALIALDQALQQLEAQDPGLVRLIELRVFAGLDSEQLADLLGVTVRTVQRDWLRARAWVGAALEQ